MVNPGDNINPENNIHLPLEPLFTLLRSNGFMIKPDHYIEMLKIVQYFGSDNLDETMKWLGPVIVTTQSEQSKFYKVIEEYKKLYLPPSPVHLLPPPGLLIRTKNWFSKNSKLIVIILILCTISLLIIVINFDWKTKINLTQYPEQIVEKRDSLTFDARNLFQQNMNDTARSTIMWKMEKGLNKKGISVSHVFKDTGDFIVKRKFESDVAEFDKTEDSFHVDVCEDLPKVTITSPDETVVVNQKVLIFGKVDANRGTVMRNQWTVNDSIIKTDTLSFEFVFDSEGSYELKLTSIVSDTSDPRTQSDEKIINVIEPGSLYEITNMKKTALSDTKKVAKTWILIILFLPVIGALTFFLLKRRKKESVTHVKEKLPPLQIPFENNELSIVKEESDFYRLFIQMRNKNDEEVLKFNLPHTIHSVIRSGGIPILEYAPGTKPREYLILIDRINPKGMITHLFNYVYKRMIEEDISVTRFFYDGKLNCYNENFPDGISLQRLADLSYSSTLLIMGKAHEFVNKVLPVIKENILEQLDKWENKAIITPVSIPDWGEKEKILSEYMLLLPADLQALNKLIHLIQDNVLNQIGPINFMGSQYSCKNVNFKNINKLFSFLNNDEVLIQWLCAICIYPTIRWEVFMEIGKTIVEKYEEPEKLNYSNLLKLCRISWLQEGVFPQHLRLELLKDLNIENEIAARKAFLRMLHYSGTISNDQKYFFESERKRLQLTNEFILYANDKVEFEKYKESDSWFKDIWSKDLILDAPLKKYLNKQKEDEWKTPLNSNKKSVSLDEYFNKRFSINDIIDNRVIAIASTLLFVFTFLLYYLGGLEDIAGGSLYDTKDLAEVSFYTKVLRNFSECGDSIKVFDNLDGFVTDGKQNFQLTYNKDSNSLFASIPSGMLKKGNAILGLKWGDEVLSESQIKLDPDSVLSSFTIFCSSADSVCHSLKINGVKNNYASVASSESLNSIIRSNGFTLEGWIKIKDLNNYPYFSFLDKEGSWYFEYANLTNSMSLVSPGVTAMDFPCNPRLDRWLHVALTYDKSTNAARFYENGVFSSQRIFPMNFVESNNPLLIGYGKSGDPEFGSGSIDEIRIWNLVRTDQQIRNNYNVSFLNTLPGLVAYYKFENSRKNIINDGSGNFNYATLINNPELDPDCPPVKYISKARIESPIRKTVKKFSVEAINENGQSTGIKVYAGDTLKITASGTWGWGCEIPPDCRCGPEGHPILNNFPAEPCPFPDKQTGLLIGKINNIYFPIGAGTTFVSRQKGVLYLMMNDRFGSYDDNWGSMNATVTLIGNSFSGHI